MTESNSHTVTIEPEGSQYRAECSICGHLHEDPSRKSDAQRVAATHLRQLAKGKLRG